MSLAWIQTTGFILAFLSPYLLGTSFFASSLSLSKIHLLICSILSLILSLPNPSVSTGFLDVLSQHTRHMSSKIFGSEGLSGVCLSCHSELPQGRTRLTCCLLCAVQGSSKYMEGRSTATNPSDSCFGPGPSTRFSPVLFHYTNGRFPWLR